MEICGLICRYKKQMGGRTQMKRKLIWIVLILAMLSVTGGIVFVLVKNLGDAGKKEPPEPTVAEVEKTTETTTAEAQDTRAAGIPETTGAETQEKADGTTEAAGAKTAEKAEGTTEATGAKTAEKAEGTTETTGAETQEKAEGTTEATDAKTAEKTEGSTETLADGTVTREEFVYREREISDDTEAPIFLWCPSVIRIRPGESFDVRRQIGYADDVDRELTLDVSGTVDVYTEGNYPIHVTLTDDTGKTAEADIRVEVTSLASQSMYEESYEDFADFKKTYAGEHVSFGIDVSRWQGAIDFEQVKEAGCEFVIMRIGGYAGGFYTDDYFYSNMKNAKAAGLKVGIYWHGEESTPEQVRASVAYLLSTLNWEELDFPIAYDWEAFTEFQNFGMNLYDINACFETFCDELEAVGYEACNYSSKNYLRCVWTNVEQHPVWLAHYIDETDYEGEYYMWQHANTGHIPGIDGYVDLDVWYH